MSDDFNIPVPQDELDAKPTFLMPAGWYTTTLQPGTEAVGNDNGWAGVRIPFAGFTSKADGKTFDRSRNYQVTTAAAPGPKAEQAVSIGRKQLVEIAVAFGLAEQTTVDGKPAQRLTATSVEEFIAQLGSVAGSPCDVYVTAKQRKRDGKVVQRNDATGPVMDNEISRVAPAGQGK